MILLDWSAMCIANIMAQVSSDRNKEINENLVRHIILSTILSYKKKFGKEFGQPVIACDGYAYWRKDVFPNYKAHRKKQRDDSGFDWPTIYKCMDVVLKEIREYFPYKIVKVEKAEADDVIATICMHSPVVQSGLFEEREPILICSSDGDYKQLQKYDNVKQYCPKSRKFIKAENPQRYLKEHIINGDSGDGIPNMASPGNSFVDGIRQKSIYKDDLAVWITQEPEEFCNEEQLKNYYRNKKLIDFTEIPENIQQNILEAFNRPIPPKSPQLFNYFIEKQLKYLSEDINNF